MIARDNRIHHVVADLLVEKSADANVINDAGWPCTRHRDGYVMHVDVDLDEVDDDGESARWMR